MKNAVWGTSSFADLAPSTPDIDWSFDNNHRTRLSEDTSANEKVVHSKQLDSRSPSYHSPRQAFIYRETYFLDELFYMND